MKLKHQIFARDEPTLARKRVHRSAWSQASALLCPTVIAVIVGWRIFASLGDWPLSLVLGCVAFITLTPLMASMSDRDLARRRQNK